MLNGRGPRMIESTHPQTAFSSSETTPLNHESSAAPSIGSTSENHTHKDSVNQLYYPVERSIEKLSLGFSHLCFIRGMPGIGKSTQIRKCLKKFKMKYHEVSGEITEAYLYRTLYENRNKTIWFKDVARLLKGSRSIDLLKSACETETDRTINSYNYGHHNSDLPDRFQFKGKLIFDFNSLNGLKFKEDFEALTSRGDFIDLVFSPRQMETLLRSVCSNHRETEITEFLLTNLINTAPGHLNLRTQRRAFMTAKYAKAKNECWRTEVLLDLDSQETAVRRMLRPLIGKTPIQSKELKRQLVRNGLVATIRTADRRIADWIELGELFQVSDGDRNYFLSLHPLPSKTE